MKLTLYGIQCVFSSQGVSGYFVLKSLYITWLRMYLLLKDWIRLTHTPPPELCLL